MAQQHATRENIRTSSKVLNWDQEEARKTTNRQRIAESLEARGLTYRDR